ADELAAVSPEDVQRVVKTWLVPQQRTVGWQLPDDSSAPATGGQPGPETAPAARPFDPHAVWGLSDSDQSSHGFVRTELPNGIVVLAQPRPGDGAVDCTISIDAGQSATGESRPGLPSMTAKMLNRGTAKHSFDAFNEKIDTLGAVIGVDADRDTIDVSFHSLAEDLDAVLDLAAEIILEPTFPADELERVRQQTITGLREQESDTGAQASRLLREQMYPEGHPYRLRVTGEIETVEQFTPEDLATYHERAFGPNVTTISLVGGVASLDDLTPRLNRVFGDWTGSVQEPHDVPAIHAPDATSNQSTVVRGKSQADIAIAYPTLPRSLDKPYIALSIANIILGQLGLMGRLGANVRDRQGLAYYAYSSIAGGRANSVWTARAGVDPADIQRAIDGVISELSRLRSEPVTVDELADAKSYVIGSLPLGLESLGGVVSLLLTIERFGYPLNYVDIFPSLVSDLTIDDLLESSRLYLDPARLTIGVAGPESIRTEAGTP
ncbi:MAG TPA: pitrilysin family protein, partial [Thermomicrobiales bacterium]|nr:pitrilysin family protein [Thermomicrobiales bacterium]